MSGFVVNKVRRGFYLESVALMRLSARIAAMAEVEDAALMMGTPANKQIMAEAGLLDAAGQGAEGGDLVIALRAESREAAKTALTTALCELERPRSQAGAAAAWRPRTLRAALKVAPQSNLAFISVPGDFAAAEARKALRAGLHVMLFSDNVSLEDEVALKREAQDLGLMMMGPDCGTAILGGVPLGFANVVPRGDIGLIGSSGTGTQEVSCLVAQGGRGISQAIGVGGRDLSEEVGGIMTLMALDALDADPATRCIVIVSKPPSPAVAKRIFERVADSNKTITACLLGGGDYEVPPNAFLAKTLKAAAEHALGDRPTDSGLANAVGKLGKGRNHLRGLFAGGTLCAEAQVVFRMAGCPVASNAPIPGALPLAGDDQPIQMIDLGADEFTRGRPHPMIDPSVRDAALAKALDEPLVGLVLLDLVIGHGAHRDPAGHLARKLADRPPEGPQIIVSVTGTDQDPQGRSDQVAALEAAGVHVAPSNAEAAELGLALLEKGS